MNPPVSDIMCLAENCFNTISQLKQNEICYLERHSCYKGGLIIFLGSQILSALSSLECQLLCLLVTITLQKHYILSNQFVEAEKGCKVKDLLSLTCVSFKNNKKISQKFPLITDSASHLID